MFCPATHHCAPRHLISSRYFPDVGRRFNCNYFRPIGCCCSRRRRNYRFAHAGNAPKCSISKVHINSGGQQKCLNAIGAIGRNDARLNGFPSNVCNRDPPEQADFTTGCRWGLMVFRGPVSHKN